MSVRDVTYGMATMIWAMASEWPGHNYPAPPPGAERAAAELKLLYEEANEISLAQITANVRYAARELGESPDVFNDEVAGSLLADRAMGAPAGAGRYAYQDRFAQIVEHTQPPLIVPTFEAHLEHGNTLVWVGEALASRAALAMVPNPYRGPRILLVEDEPDLQRGTTRWLEKMFPGTPILVTDNVAAAIANIRASEVSLIVSDVDLIGDQSGIDLFRWVQTHEPNLVDRFVFFSGNLAELSRGSGQPIHYRHLDKGGATQAELKRVILAPAPSRLPRAARAPVIKPVIQGAQVDMDAFVRAITEVAATVHGEQRDGAYGRVGDRKVFISALWRKLMPDPRFAGVSYREFQRALVQSMRQGRLELARADMVAAMSRGEVRESEVTEGNATYHFVIDPAFRDARPRTAAAPPDQSNLLPAVMLAMPRVGPEGRFGNDKVFIVALWRQLARQGSNVTLSQFKRWLLVANRERQLDLARADLVGAMDRTLVAESEILDMGSTFHFVMDPAFRDAPFRQNPVGNANSFVRTNRSAGGTQGGVWYQDQQGQAWFGKHYYGDADRVSNEHVANQLYRMFGVAAPETQVAKVDGMLMMMSKEVQGRVARSLDDLAQTDIQTGFVIDAWLKNHDVIGTSYDNVIINGPRATRIDNGGAMIYRAMGGAKDFDAPVGELRSMRTMGTAGRVFGSLSDQDVDAQVQDFAGVFEANRAAINALLDRSGLSVAAREQVRSGLMARGDWLRDSIRP